MIFPCYTVDALDRHSLHRHTAPVQLVEQLFEKGLPLEILADKYLVNFFSGLYGLDYGAYAEYIVG